MTVRRRASRGGFSAIELTIVLAIGASAVLVAVQLFSTSSRVSEIARERMRLAALHRSGEAQLTWLLRSAAPATLSGFDAKTGIATAPTFRRVTGGSGGTAVLGPSVTLRWAPVSGTVPGIGQPGKVMLFGDGNPRVVARDVPAGGFSVTRGSRGLTVALQTYRVVDRGADAVTVSSSRVVALRNGG